MLVNYKSKKITITSETPHAFGISIGVKSIVIGVIGPRWFSSLVALFVVTTFLKIEQ